MLHHDVYPYAGSASTSRAATSIAPQKCSNTEEVTAACKEGVSCGKWQGRCREEHHCWYRWFVFEPYDDTHGLSPVNLAFALTMQRGNLQHKPRVGILDLDIFGPSTPKLMGLDTAEEPRLSEGRRLRYFTNCKFMLMKHPGGAIIPLTNHGLPCMSMGFLLPRSTDTNTSTDTPVVWRGLMVQKAVQQLLFDVDWRQHDNGPGLDMLVIDMPPGTGDVPLTLGQLVNVDGEHYTHCMYKLDLYCWLPGAVIVSTPQDVALADVRKGVAMFKKISVPVCFRLLFPLLSYSMACSKTR